MRSLTGFPADFQPLVVVTGDRREVPPQSKGDMLAYSVSITDTMYMNFLQLGGALVQTDKMFVVEAEDRLRRKFGQTKIRLARATRITGSFTWPVCTGRAPRWV